MSTDHRKKSKHKRNGRDRYEKGQQHHQTAAPKKLIKGYRGTVQNPKEPLRVTLADVWPK